MSRERDPDDFAKELQSHLDAEADALREAGLDAESAHRDARRRFGGVTQAREQFRDARSWRRLETFWQDIRYGARLMRRSPAFTVTAIVVLSLGIGVNTALFSIVSSLFNRDLHVRAPEQLFGIYNVLPSNQVVPEMEQQRAELFRAVMADLADFTTASFNRGRLAAEDFNELAYGAHVAPGYFDLLGVPMQLGRAFREEDDRSANTELSVVISDTLWLRAFHRRSDIIGQPVRIDDKVFRVIGVAPSRFAGLGSPFKPQLFWVPGAQATGRDRWHGLLLGRVKPGRSLAEVRAVVAANSPLVREQVWETFSPRTRGLYPNWLRGMPFPVHRIVDLDDPSDVTARLVPVNVLAAVTTVVGLVLIIATANIAGLLLARGLARTGEVAVRQALGAGRTRLIRQILTESVLLSGAGGVVGALLAAALVRLFVAVTPSALVVDAVLDSRALLFALGVCVGTGVVMGMAPALQAARIQVLEALGGGLVGSRRTGAGLRRWIVVPQIAFALVLLLVAAVHVRTLVSIELSDLGYRTSGTVVVRATRDVPIQARNAMMKAAGDYMTFNAEQAAATRAFDRAILDQAANIPGLDSYAISNSLPLRSVPVLPSVIDRDAYLARQGSQAVADRALVSDGYFQVLGMRLIRGRTFDSRDQFNGRRAAVISEDLARTMWPTDDPIGKTMAFLKDDPSQMEWLDVVGIVNAVDPVLKDKGGLPSVYLSILQEWRGDPYYLIARANGVSATLIRDLKDAVIGADAFAYVHGVQTMSQMVGEILYPRRVAAGILATAGFIGLVLACIGLYGVVAFAAAQRQRELGIRATLGATRRDLIGLVLKEGTTIMAIGTAAGLVLSVLALRLTAGVIPDLPTLDPVAFAVAPLTLVAVVLAACLIPARRAASIDPARVLRGE